MDDEFYETSGIQLGEELYSNREAFDKENEASMVKQDQNQSEVKLDNENDPRSQSVDVSVDKITKKWSQKHWRHSNPSTALLIRGLSGLI